MGLRLKRLLQKIDSSSLDALLVTSEPNVSYLSGFKGGESIALVSTKGCYFLTDFRYIEEAHKEVSPDFKIVRIERPLSCAAKSPFADTLSFCGVKRLGFEGAHISFSLYERLKNSLTGVKLLPTSNLVEGLRELKDNEEINILKEAAKKALAGVSSAKTFLKPGRTEREAAADLEYFFKTHGADKASFDIIVAGGSNSSMPHAMPTNYKLKKNDQVLIDAGVRLKGYNSDLTRTLFLGRMTRKARRFYNIVHNAQKSAIDVIRPGIKISEVDKAGRSVIEAEGLGKYFGHSLGHGVGLEVHEKPRIANNETGRLKEGMVFTIEPGVYIPDWGGIRIEDMVLVTKSGCEVLTR